MIVSGTNTYLVGTTNPFILIDTGEGKDEYIDELESALKQYSDFSRQLISDVILTHRHHDHTDGLPSVLVLLNKLRAQSPGCFTFPRIHKYPSLPLGDGQIQSLLKKLPPNFYAEISNLGLQRGQILSSPGCTLQVLHTPGHTVDSISLYLPEEKALFVGDTVLGQGTAVFEDLHAYTQSLQQLLQFNNQLQQPYQQLYPGHGPVVTDGPTLVEKYIDHRRERENQILQLMKSKSSEGSYIWTMGELVAKIYAHYPKSLWGPATGSMHLHLQKLEKDKVAIYLDGEEIDARWVLTSKHDL